MKVLTTLGYFNRVKRDIVKESRRVPKRYQSSKAARFAASEMDSAIQANRRTTFACSKGCAYCCHLMTDITAGEAFVLAKAVRAMPDDKREEVIRKLRENATALSGMSYTARLEAGVPCALLDPETKACSVYDSRPTNCRKWHSLNVSACKADFEKPGCKEGHVTLDPTAMNAATLVYEAYKEAMREPIGELHQGVVMALHVDSERRFSQGVPVFAGWTPTDANATAEELAEVHDRVNAVAEAAARISSGWRV